MKKKSKVILSLIIGLGVSFGSFSNVFASTADGLYLNAYTLAMNALTLQTQKSINSARIAIDALKGTSAAWSIGQLSSTVDSVQQPILVKIINAITKAQDNPTQANVNAAKASIDPDLIDIWRNSYNSAVDKIEQGIINNAVEAYNKALQTNNTNDIKNALAKINEIKTSSDINVANWANSFGVQVTSLAIANDVHSGDRTDPINLSKNQQLTFQNYSFYAPKNIELQLQEIYTGDDANKIVASENMFNTVPNSDQEWVLMKFNLKYVSGSENTLDATDVIWDNFYSIEGAKISILDRASFSSDRKDINDVELYPGASSTFWHAVLVKKSDWNNPLLRIGTGYDSVKYETQYTWYSIK